MRWSHNDESKGNELDMYNFYQMDKLTVAPVFNRQLPNLVFFVGVALVL